MAGVNRALVGIKKSVKGYGKRDDDREMGAKSIRNGVLNDKKRGSILPAMPMTHERGWDRQKKRKIHESDEQGMNIYRQKKTSLQKEKESWSSDHSSCATTATIDEGCTTSQLSPTRVLRAAQLKKRFADLIFKANHQSVMTQGNKGDPLKLQQERERLQREKIAEQARIEQQIKSAEALLRQREREAARIALEKMEKTIEFNDALQIMRDFESLLNCVS